MKKLYLMLGVILALIVGVTFTAKNVAAVDSRDQTASLIDVKNNGGKPPSSNEENYKELEQKALSNIKEGWFYMRDYVDYDVDTLTEEGETPLVDTTTEYWFYINASGVVEKSISIGRTLDSDVPLVGIFSNGTSWDTVVDELRPTEPYLFEALDYGLLSHLKKLELKSEKSPKKMAKRL